MEKYNVQKLERRYSQCRFIASEAKGLSYAVDDDRRGLVIIGERGMVGLTREQARAAIAELAEVYDMFVARRV